MRFRYPYTADSSHFFSCSTDIAPPTFKPGCPSNIFKDADRTSTSAVVTWDSVRAEDNSGGAPNVTHFGRSPGSRFPEGEHQIKYIAVDSSDNIAECVFRVIVKGETDQNINSNTTHHVLTTSFCFQSSAVFLRSSHLPVGQCLATRETYMAPHARSTAHMAMSWRAQPVGRVKLLTAAYWAHGLEIRLNVKVFWTYQPCIYHIPNIYHPHTDHVTDHIPTSSTCSLLLWITYIVSTYTHETLIVYLRGTKWVSISSFLKYCSSETGNSIMEDWARFWARVKVSLSLFTQL